jgi:hypothetical protein
MQLHVSKENQASTSLTWIISIIVYMFSFDDLVWVKTSFTLQKVEEREPIAAYVLPTNPLIVTIIQKLLFKKLSLEKTEAKIVDEIKTHFYIKITL